MTGPVDTYLSALQHELQRLGVAEMYDALNDARQSIVAELWRCRASRPELDEPTSFACVIDHFGGAEEVALAYKHAEGHGSPLQERIRRLRRFSYAPGWKITCPKCKRTSDLESVAPFSVRIGAQSVGKSMLGWCLGCGQPRMLRLYRLG